MNNEMILLATHFLEKVKGFTKDAHGKIDCDNQYKTSVVDDIGRLLAGGTDPAVIAKCIEDIQGEDGKEMYFKPSHLLKRFGIPFQLKEYRDPDNLIKIGKFYYHPRLQVTPPPPMLVIHDNGEIDSSYDEEPFYLEIVDRFTKKDVVDYFYYKMNKSTDTEASLARDLGAVEHMLKFWDLDFILYLIDEAFAVTWDEGLKPMKNLLDVQHFEESAVLVYENRINTCYEGGLDRVIPRRR